MTKQEIRETIFSLQPAEKVNFFPKEYNYARAAIFAVRKKREAKIVSSIIGRNESPFGRLSVYYPKIEGERIVSA